MHSIRFVIACVLALLIAGCVTPVSRDIPRQISLKDQKLSAGEQYEIFMKSEGDRQISYLGTISEANEKIVSLNNATKFARVTTSPPIPLIGPLFQNKGIGSESVEGTVMVRREDITRIRSASMQ